MKRTGFCGVLAAAAILLLCACSPDVSGTSSAAKTTAPSTRALTGVQEECRQAAVRALDLYGDLYAGILIAFDLNQTREADGKTWYRVNDEGIPTYAALKSRVRQAYTQEMTDKLLAYFGDHYRDMGGQFYMTDQSGPFVYGVMNGEVLDVKEDGDTVTMSFCIKVVGDEQADVSCTLQKESGGWRLAKSDKLPF